MNDLSLSPALPIPVSHEETPGEQTFQFCTFTLDLALFGVDILDVQEIATVPDITTVHHAPRHVAGVVNIRGQVVLCLDLRGIFGLEPVVRTKESRLILFKRSVGEDFGILVDEVGDIVEASENMLENRRRTTSGAGTGALGAGGTIASSDVVRGVCKLDGALMLVIDARLLLKELDTCPVREHA